MTNEDFQKLVLEKLTDMSTEIKEVKQSLARIELDHGTKLAALFDGYALRGEQIERLQEFLEDRLDAMQNDLSYVVSKVAQHDRNIVQLKKATRTSILAASGD